MNVFEGYRITSPYGMRSDPFTHEQKKHTGIDLVKFDKAPLFAFMGGKVVHAQEGVAGSGFGGFGNVVAIEDVNGAIQFYAHLSSISVVVGQVVEAGQEVGKQGNTGHSAGSHLHFEVRTSHGLGFGFGTDIEPTAYLQKYMEDDEEMKEQLEALIKQMAELKSKVTLLEGTVKVLTKTKAPDWFVEEFGVNALIGIVDTPVGDEDFWRNTAISIRLNKKK